jgi:hypothetical protein
MIVLSYLKLLTELALVPGMAARAVVDSIGAGARQRGLAPVGICFGRGSHGVVSRRAGAVGAAPRSMTATRLPSAGVL